METVTNFQNGKLAFNVLVFLLGNKGKQQLEFDEMVHIGLQKRRVATKKRKSHLLFEEVFPLIGVIHTRTCNEKILNLFFVTL